MTTFMSRFSPEQSEAIQKAVEQGTPFASSLILHLIGLGIFGLLLISPGESPNVSTIVADFNDVDTEAVTLIEPASLADSESSQSAPLGLANDLLTAVTDRTANRTPRIDEAIPLELSPTGFSAGLMSEEVGDLASVDTGNGGNGYGIGGDGNGAGDSNFFGLDLNGQSVVFVVDASQSMYFPYPGPAKTRFGRVQLELLKTIGNMTEKERFFIIFFNHNAIPMPADRLMEATKSSKERYLTWMAKGKAGGRTEPEVALLMALRLRPEIIYFLTDGNFDYRVVKNVTMANRQNVAINCIGFGDDQGERFLKQIASRNGGTYRFIPNYGLAPVPSGDKPSPTAPKVTSLPDFSGD